MKWVSPILHVLVNKQSGEKKRKRNTFVALCSAMRLLSSYWIVVYRKDVSEALVFHSVSSQKKKVRCELVSCTCIRVTNTQTKEQKRKKQKNSSELSLSFDCDFACLFRSVRNFYRSTLFICQNFLIFRVVSRSAYAVSQRKSHKQISALVLLYIFFILFIRSSHSHSCATTITAVYFCTRISK